MLKLRELKEREFFLEHGELYAVLKVGDSAVQVVRIADVSMRLVNVKREFFPLDTEVHRVVFTLVDEESSV